MNITHCPTCGSEVTISGIPDFIGHKSEIGTQSYQPVELEQCGWLEYQFAPEHGGLGATFHSMEWSSNGSPEPVFRKVEK